MKKILLSVSIFLLFTINCFASAPTRPNSYVAGTTIDPVAVTLNETTLYSYLQSGVDTFAPGSIANSSISNTAGITYGKLNLSGSILGSDIANNANVSIGTLGVSGLITVSTGIIDNGTFNLGSTHQGDVLYDNGTSIVRLTPGTAGQVLQTQGGTANPQWSYPSGQLGAWDATKSEGTIYQAATDGFVVGHGASSGGGGSTIIVVTDSSATPTTQRYNSGSSLNLSFTVPVRKNDYWKVDNGGRSTAVYWIPLGS